MTWAAVSAIGEIVGAIAVVLTLIYLAVQVRQSTRTTQAISIQAASSLDQEFLLTIGSDAARAQLWAAYLLTPATLSDEQQLQGAYLMASFVRRLENIYLQKRLGALSKEGWQSRGLMFERIASSPGYEAYLRSIPGSFVNLEFREFMDKLRLKRPARCSE